MHVILPDLDPSVVYCARETELFDDVKYYTVVRTDTSNLCIIDDISDEEDRLIRNETIWVTTVEREIWRSLSDYVRFSYEEKAPALTSIHPSVIRVDRE